MVNQCPTLNINAIGRHKLRSILSPAAWTARNKTTQFERETADYIGAARGVAVSNGTAALHLLYQALGVNQNSLLWTSPISFVASANAARYLGATVDFVDVDPATGCIDPAALATKFAKAASVGKLPNVLAAVHLAGHSFEFDRIAELCAQFGVTLIEDAAHALGAFYQDNPTRKIGAHPLLMRLGIWQKHEWRRLWQ